MPLILLHTAALLLSAAPAAPKDCAATAEATAPAPVEVQQNGASSTEPRRGPPPQAPAGENVIRVEGEGAIARCCPLGASEEECRAYLSSDATPDKNAQCAVNGSRRE